ncbi:bifunctional glutamate N-acetyltransferase/amino-acid acetyltransferase ArgJ [Kocuria sp. HSID16901]|uniref:bifunctional glutamate N-acetyltransferase/amino-acid acetyltransferase ArgJ n=1 Tax=Kocuria sp. HSID16901 TaxID=2419505 RepID=UPI0009E3A81B|nr:bifunctional glutamate N-acetyltransferase/amino-acid acetyltransferase ArgJ [Kocuria sp. HSID16901]RUQ21092.1 bifunctional glutamate N-acetyltransferase/amino-acid acetyltransferase ArgJ [Kocuria sp. HSID16901]
MSTPTQNSPLVSTEQGLAEVLGLQYSGVRAGLKASGSPDVALVHNQGPEFSAASVFTTNRFAAAPVEWSREAVSDGRADAVVVNSGGANACTGPEGFAATHRTAEHVANLLGVSALDVVVCSTGLIGEQLPMDKLLPGLDHAVTELGAGGLADDAAARAIMTTDTVPKKASLAFDTDEGTVHVGGVAKGAGMLAPGLATMLVVLATDASLPSDVLNRSLHAATEQSFNRADSDGCMSTNDTVTLMASGASGVHPSETDFTEALTKVCVSLALQLISDAEGAQHDIHVTTKNAVTEGQALEVSRAVARSNLFKCAIFGNDPNWGRILSEVGTTQAEFTPGAVNVSINGVEICRGGAIGDDRDLVDLAADRKVDVVIDLAAGDQSATIWTNDLTYDYVEENSAYSS